MVKNAAITARTARMIAAMRTQTGAFCLCSDHVPPSMILPSSSSIVYHHGIIQFLSNYLLVADRQGPIVLDELALQLMAHFPQRQLNLCHDSTTILVVVP